MKKYELLKDCVEFDDGVKLFRIRLLVDLASGRKGTLGGFIEKEDNLSHDGECWVHDHAMVYGEARISGNARVYDYAQVYGNASVSGDALVYGNTKMYGEAKVYDNARIYSDSKLYGNVQVYGGANVFGREVCGNVRLCGGAEANQGEAINSLEFKLTTSKEMCINCEKRVPTIDIVSVTPGVSWTYAELTCGCLKYDLQPLLEYIEANPECDIKGFPIASTILRKKKAWG